MVQTDSVAGSWNSDFNTPSATAGTSRSTGRVPVAPSAGSARGIDRAGARRITWGGKYDVASASTSARSKSISWGSCTGPATNIDRPGKGDGLAYQNDWCPAQSTTSPAGTTSTTRTTANWPESSARQQWAILSWSGATQVARISPVTATGASSRTSRDDLDSGIADIYLARAPAIRASSSASATTAKIASAGDAYVSSAGTIRNSARYGARTGRSNHERHVRYTRNYLRACGNVKRGEPMFASQRARTRTAVSPFRAVTHKLQPLGNCNDRTCTAYRECS